MIHTYLVEVHLTGGQIPHLVISKKGWEQGYRFVSEGLVKPYVNGLDSTLLKSKGHVWHISSKSKGIIPRLGFRK